MSMDWINVVSRANIHGTGALVQTDAERGVIAEKPGIRSNVSILPTTDVLETSTPRAEAIEELDEAPTKSLSAKAKKAWRLVKKVGLGVASLGGAGAGVGVVLAATAVEPLVAIVALATTGVVALPAIAVGLTAVIVAKNKLAQPEPEPTTVRAKIGRFLKKVGFATAATSAIGGSAVVLAGMALGSAGAGLSLPILVFGAPVAAVGLAAAGIGALLEKDAPKS